MLFLRLLSLISGYLQIEITGVFTERLLNLFSKNKIYIWKITRSRGGNSVRCKIKIKDFKKIRKYVKKTKTHVRIIKKCGLPFVIHKYRFRYGILAGILIFSAIVFFLSTMVWRIEITGNNHIQAQQIITTLDEHGITTGIFGFKVKTREVEADLKRDISMISWVKVGVRGSVLTVNIKEAVPPPELVRSDEPCNIIADYDCQIISMMIFTGQAQVETGNTVSKGDVIVSGAVETTMTSPVLVHAQAQIKGHSIVTVKSEIPLDFKENLPTGKEYKRFSLHFLNKCVKLYTGDKIKYNDYTSVGYINDLKIGSNFTLPFSLEVQRIIQMGQVKTTLGEDEAYSLAELSLKEKERIALADSIIVSCEQSRSIVNGVAIIENVYVLERDIGREQSVSAETAVVSLRRR